MKIRREHIALFFSFLIATGFITSGYHFHNHRYISDDLSEKTNITRAPDNCLYCQGIFFDVVEPVTVSEPFRPTGLIVSDPPPILSDPHDLLQKNRGPPAV